MSFVAIAGTAITAGSAIYMGSQQRKRAKAIRNEAVDPGIQPNYALDRVTNTLYDRYSNFNLPGYNRYAEQIKQLQAAGNNAVIQGATSSGDLLDGIGRNQVIADQSLNNLFTQNASGREAALMQYLNSVNMQGQDDIRVNQTQLGRYDQTLREAAALEGAGTQNMYQGLQDATIGVGAVASNFMPRTTVNPNTGQVITLPSAWQAWRKYRNSN